MQFYFLPQKYLSFVKWFESQEAALSVPWILEYVYIYSFSWKKNCYATLRSWVTSFTIGSWVPHFWYAFSCVYYDFIKLWISIKIFGVCWKQMPILLLCNFVCHRFFWICVFNNPGYFLGTKGAKPISPEPSLFFVSNSLADQYDIIEAVILIHR